MMDINWVKESFPDLEGICLLDSGGQKHVYTCQHPDWGEVVLKIILPSTSKMEIERELIAVGKVQSQRIPKIYGSGEKPSPVGDCIWILEQRIIGTNLRARLQKSQLSAQEALSFTCEMLEILAEAERVHIVHRDVKPENIIVDLKGEYWLIDFGIARHLSMQSLTATAMFFGKFTLGYAPPEQIRNDKPNIDCRADLFALGLTIYESITGVHPFRDGANGPHEIVDRSEKVPLPRLQTDLVDAVGFADLVDAMTKKRRDHRCSTVLEALMWAREIRGKERCV